MADIETGKKWNYDLEKQHLVTHQNIYAKDLGLWRRQCFEAMEHSGYKVEYFNAIDRGADLYQDPITQWEDSIILSCILDEHPKVKLLKEYGWYNEDEDLRGSIIYLPMYKDWTCKEIFHVEKESLVRVSYFGQTSPKDFRISDIQEDSVYGVYYICKIVPERFDNFEYITENGNHYLKKKYGRDPECDHEKKKVKDSPNIYHNEDQEAYLKGKGNEGIDVTRPYEDTKKDEYQSYSQLIMNSFK